MPDPHRAHATLPTGTVTVLFTDIEGSETGRGLRLGGALQRFWMTRGHLSEGREWCTRVLGTAGAEAPTAERAKVLNGTGLLAYHQVDYPAARALTVEQVVELAVR